MAADHIHAEETAQAITEAGHPIDFEGLRKLVGVLARHDDLKDQLDHFVRWTKTHERDLEPHELVIPKELPKRQW